MKSFVILSNGKPAHFGALDHAHWKQPKVYNYSPSLENKVRPVKIKEEQAFTNSAVLGLLGGLPQRGSQHGSPNRPRMSPRKQ